jgi:hypothetical protein
MGAVFCRMRAGYLPGESSRAARWAKLKPGTLSLPAEPLWDQHAFPVDEVQAEMRAQDALGFGDVCVTIGKRSWPRVSPWKNNGSAFVELTGNFTQNFGKS